MQKIFKILNRYYNKIELEEDGILALCHKIASIEMEEFQDNQKTHDNFCPHCKNTDSNIVNKYRFVMSTSVSTKIRFGFGNIINLPLISTIPINHCNNCGNEWEKFKTKIIRPVDILRVALNYLGQIINNPSQKRHSWKVNTIEVFNNCHLETIIALRNKHKQYLHDSTLKALRKKNLKARFNSFKNSNNKLKNLI